MCYAGSGTVRMADGGGRDKSGSLIKTAGCWGSGLAAGPSHMSSHVLSSSCFHIPAVCMHFTWSTYVCFVSVKPILAL